MQGAAMLETVGIVDRQHVRVALRRPRCLGSRRDTIDLVEKSRAGGRNHD